MDYLTKHGKILGLLGWLGIPQNKINGLFIVGTLQDRRGWPGAKTKHLSIYLCCSYSPSSPSSSVVDLALQMKYVLISLYFPCFFNASFSSSSWPPPPPLPPPLLPPPLPLPPLPPASSSSSSVLSVVMIRHTCETSDDDNAHGSHDFVSKLWSLNLFSVGRVPTYRSYGCQCTLMSDYCLVEVPIDMLEKFPRQQK